MDARGDAHTYACTHYHVCMYDVHMISLKIQIPYKVLLYVVFNYLLSECVRKYVVWV